uniref:PIN domain-containing protein n=1 Tax=Candidatus Kentrum sp. FW TaxID=2126338 RepID=A0A450THL5_9GAMM|nr:MAG: PIN domain-containing protein [Candidatus Kentron sp. FW]
MKKSVYVETSVISYLASRSSRDIIVAGRQAISRDWWENQRQRFDLRISSLVEEEISRGDSVAAKRRESFTMDIPSLAVSNEAIALAEALMEQRAIPKGSEEDAFHIAIAATQGVDFLLTWNFRHINNAETKRFIAEVVESHGYACPQLCSPEELGGNKND